MQNDPLFQPFQLKHLTLKNRIMSTSHAPAYAEEALPKEQYQLYHEEKANGGIGLTMFGGSSTISPDCPASFGQLAVGEPQPNDVDYRVACYEKLPVNDVECLPFHPRRIFNSHPSPARISATSALWRTSTMERALWPTAYWRKRERSSGAN